jgi:hypothetical protein
MNVFVMRCQSDVQWREEPCRSCKLNNVPSESTNTRLNSLVYLLPCSHCTASNHQCHNPLLPISDISQKCSIITTTLTGFLQKSCNIDEQESIKEERVIVVPLAQVS